MTKHSHAADDNLDSWRYETKLTDESAKQRGCGWVFVREQGSFFGKVCLNLVAAC